MHKVRSTYQQLYEGCLTGAIAHAVWVMGTPALKYLQYWDAANFHLKDLTGAFCTISFRSGRLFGAFFDPAGDRSPFRPGNHYSLELFIDPLPLEIRQLARSETLLYFLQDFEGRELPLITSVLWSQDEQLFTPEEPETFRSNGGRLIDHHLLGGAPSLAQWRREYNLSDYDVSFIEKLVRQKMQLEDEIVVSPKEIESLSTFESKDVASMRELLGYMKITLP